MAHIETRETRTGTRYRARVYIAPGRFMSKTFADEAEAKLWAAEREVKRSKNTLTEPSKEKLSSYGRRRWLEDVARDQVSASTWHGYHLKFNLYIERLPLDGPSIGRTPLDELRPEHFQQLYGWLRNKRNRKLAPATVRGLHSVLRQIISHAIDTKALTDDPLRGVKRPKKRRREIKAMSPEELGRFLKAAEADPLYAMWHLLPMTGLRPGEALGLRWDDLDLDARALRVHRSLTWLPGQEPSFGPPKTKRSERTVKLPRATVQVLREHRRRQIEQRLQAEPGQWQDDRLVFTDEAGGPVKWCLMAPRFRRIMEAAGLGRYGPVPKKPKGQPGPRKKPKFIPAYTPYQLRHTCATLLLRAGENSKVVSERLGHASVAFTMDVYTASLMDMQDGAADKLDAIVSAASG